MEGNFGCLNDWEYRKPKKRGLKQRHYLMEEKKDVDCFEGGEWYEEVPAQRRPVPRCAQKLDECLIEKKVEQVVELKM